MAFRRSQAWLTYVARDDTVASALVLAESIRRTRTTRPVAVIVSENVSKDESLALRKAFDYVFLLDKNLVSSKDHAEISGKIFAFSLEVFERCIYVAPGMLFLENCDELFDAGKDEYKDLSGSWEMFRFVPNLALCEYLEANHSGKAGNPIGSFWENLNDWLENNFVTLNSNYCKKTTKTEKIVVEFSAETGNLIQNGSVGNPAIIQVKDVPRKKNTIFVRMMKLFQNPNLGLYEKTIVREWLNIFQERVTCILAASKNLKLTEKPHETTKSYQKEPIAIVGMACRLPGANSLEEFWNLLYSGQEGVRKPPTFRWRKEHTVLGGSEKERKTEAGFLNVPIDTFDSKFFGMSPKDAELLDPQSRLLHEVLWESLENAGIDPLSLRESHTGIFTGSWMNDYKDIIQASTERDFFRTYMGNSIGATAARLSFLLGLTGPNIATESGCSSAIVALDMAVTSLRKGESSLALAGGVNLLLHPFKGDIIDYVIAPDGRCKTFDEKANGFGRAEACAVLVLKRFSDALRDRDNIWAIIRGSAISQEGPSRSLGTPTVQCEALAMKLALKDAGVLPEQVSFVEAHGTGTSVGDPMEVAAIAQAYHSKARKEPLVIGSVKTNVGHTESCSGITGIIKTVLAMQHELIPKHLNLETLNPEISLDAVPARIPIEPIPWPKIQGKPRFAGVSSFGITGTDGHVILEEAPEHNLPRFTTGLERPLHLIKFSAKSEQALDDLLVLYLKNFSQKDLAENFANVAYTANVGRASFAHRTFLLAGSFEQAASSLQANKLPRMNCGGNKGPEKICFLFTGQGSQYSGMAQLLYETSPVFRLHFYQCNRMIQESFDISVSDVIWSSDNKTNKISSTIYSQTSIFVVEYCLLKLWESWGVKPDYVLGHSLGEFCACVAAGILTFEDALKLVAERSHLIDSLPRGNMLVIKANLPEIKQLMIQNRFDLDVAAENSNDQTVVSGDRASVEGFMKTCKERGMKTVMLEASHAFHSRHMDHILEKYKAIAESIKSQNCRSCKYISGVTGKIVEDSSVEINSDYWVRHTREKVAFLDACNVMKELKCQNFLEIGPQPVLSTFVLQNIEGLSVACYPSLRRNTNDWETMLTSLGKLYLQGFQIDWEGFDKPYPRKKVPVLLPFHPFYRKSFWVDCSETQMATIHPLIGSPFKNASSLGIFQNRLSSKSANWIMDHHVGSRIIIPGAAIVDMCLSAGHCVANSLMDTLDKPRRPIALENLKIETPLEIPEGRQVCVQVHVQLEENGGSDEHHNESGGFRVKLFHQNQSDSESSGKWVQHATSIFKPATNSKDIMAKWKPGRIQEMLQTEKFSSQVFYKRVDGVGLKFGEAFKSIDKYAVKLNDNKKDEILAEMKIPKDHENYLLHPIIIDAMLQSIILTMFQTQNETLKLPVGIGNFVWLSDIKKASTILYLHAHWENDENCCIFALNEDLTPIAYVSNVHLFETNLKTVESILEQQTRELPDCWEEVWKPVSGPYDNRIDLPPLEPIVTSEDFETNAVNATATVAEDLEHAKNLNKFIYLCTIKAMLKLGWMVDPGDKINIPEFCEKYKILPMYQQLLHFYFKMFEEQGDLMEFQDSENCWLLKTSLPTLAEIKKEDDYLCKFLVAEKKIEKVVLIYKNIGENLHRILQGNESALQILFPSDADKQHLSADAYYRHHPGLPDITLKANGVVETLFSNICQFNNDNPKKVLRILEVGSGSGYFTEVILEKLKSVYGLKFEYYFTDISAAFFSKAAKRFEEFKENLKFEVFNVENLPLEQGIPHSYFDMVFAHEVLHATMNLEESVANLRKTLKPGGILTVIETVTQHTGITFVFGLLEGYWKFNDFEWRPHHACVSVETWSKILLKSGFGFVNATKAYMDTFGIIVAEANNNLIKHMNEDSMSKWIFFGKDTNKMHRKLVAEMKRNGLKQTTFVTNMPENLNELLNTGDLHGVIYAWGTDGETTDQRKIAEPFVHVAKCLLALKRHPKLYILTEGVHAISEGHLTKNPSPATLFGMVKSLKNENQDVFARYIDLDSVDDCNSMVSQILFELAMNKQSSEKDRVQVAYRGHVRLEPRFCQTRLNHKSEELQLPPSTNRYKLVLPESKMINDLEFEGAEEEPLEPNEVEVEVKAYSLNFRDVFAVLKPTKEFEKLNEVGTDFSGVVVKVGTMVTQAGFQVGDTVFGMSTKKSLLSSHVIIEMENIFKVPEQMTFMEASTLPVVFATSVYCLMNVAQMRKGETVLIHAASGGVGLSAIQVARHIGANIITTAGSARKRMYLRSLGIEHVFHSRETSFQEEIMKVTNGKGVDVVLNSITGPGFKEATLAVCAKNARFVEMSKMAVWTEAEVREMRPDVKYTIADLSSLDSSHRAGLTDKVNEYLNKGFVQPIPYVQFDVFRIRQALNYLQKAKHIGKVVVRMPEIKARNGQWNVVAPLFNEDSTYLVTGGLGGIGFEVCKWMLTKGATDIVLVGRNPPKPEIAEEIERINRNPKQTVIVEQADIGNFEQCRKLINKIYTNMRKPIRGIQHCAGVLKDNMFTDQTWESFDATFNPKVNGTWNLHKLTSGLPLEHFVLYSSITALVGSPAQANHASANCFEDAFAHYRYSLGLPATTINWGQWGEVGCAKEINLPGVYPVSVKRMMNGLETALRHHKVQVAFGEFQSIKTWSIVCPMFIHYLDERLLRNAKDRSESKQIHLKSDQFWQQFDEAVEKTDKIEVVVTYMKIILREALRMEQSEPINENANMSELGVDSLMLIELKNSIQSLLGSRITITANMMKDCQTITDLAVVLVNKICDNDEDFTKIPPLTPEEFKRLLESDIKLEESIQSTRIPPVDVKSIKAILITGVTGQLGPYILAALSQLGNQPLEKIICLIRTRDGKCPQEKLRNILESMNLSDRVDLPRIECVRGDVTQHNFGLSEDVYETLCKTVDCVIHLAVKSNHVENYRKCEKGTSDIRSVNVGGTLSVLKFASMGKTKSIFFSSGIVSVFGGNEQGTLCDDWPDEDQIQIIAENAIMGYPTSKFVCEMLLKQANERGIPCKVFRFPWIMGDSKTGQLNYMSNHYILRFLSYLKIKSMPDAPIPALVLPVDICADLAVQIFWNDKAPDEIYNIAHPQPQLEMEFIAVAKEDFGIIIELKDWRSTKFIEQLYATDMPLEALKEIYEDVDRGVKVATSDAFKAIQGYLSSPESFFKNAKLARLVPRYEETIPSSMQIIRQDLAFVKSKGFFKKFGINSE